MRGIAVLACMGLTVLVPSAASAAARGCEEMRRAAVKNVQVTSATEVARSLPANQFAPTRQRPFAQPVVPNLKDLPRFCRVTARLSPVPGSRIGIDLWLPEQWNGKLVAIGNHGFSGEFEHEDMALALKRGYAVVTTDGGHSERDSAEAEFAINNPVAVDDFAWRAVHEMTVAAKELVRLNYGVAARRAYFDGCSNGGREAMREAQQFPGDYDGIISGGAAMYWTRFMAGTLVQYQGSGLGGGSRMSLDKLRLATKAAIDACDLIDGVTDRLLVLPAQCRWDPRAIQCRSGADRADCLTAAEVASIIRVESPIRDPATGEMLYDGMAPGSEELWYPGMSRFNGHTWSHFRDMVLHAPSWSAQDGLTADVVQLLRMSELPSSSTLGINAVSPDLSAFRDRGGKLIQYHGWSDQAMAAGFNPRYYAQVIDLQPGPDRLARTRDFYRLFMIPGMGHCRGGRGPTNIGALSQPASPVTDADHDILEALDRWIDKGVAPDRLIATEYGEAQRPVRQMPICPWPEAAIYVGGEVSRAGSFACRATAEHRIVRQ